MSARARAESWAHSRTTTRVSAHDSTAAWAGDDEPVSTLAEEQMRGLVARVFLGVPEKSSRHVLLGAVDQETRSWDLCTQLGLALARETVGTVLVARGDAGLIPAPNPRTSVRESCLRLGPNLWMLADSGSIDGSGLSPLAYQTDSFLQQVKREFDYSIMHVVSSRLLSESTRLGKASDGLILALGNGTRRAAAQHVRQSLTTAGVRLIGAVLTGRTFPVPEGVYRRL
jgi:hypothetical protein